MLRLKAVFSGGLTEETTPIEKVQYPPWRQFDGEYRQLRGLGYICGENEVDMVNAAIYLRRPLLVTGSPGIGKSSLAYAVASELKLEPVLLWSVSTRSTLDSALYTYDAIGRLQDSNLGKACDTGQYIRLGPLGTAFLPATRPRVLLIDEIDKSDADLANDLLNIFEEGEFSIPELARLEGENAVTNVLTWDGRSTAEVNYHIRCQQFPIVIMTSNGEREFPPAFYRRCLRLEVNPPDENRLAEILRSRLKLSEVEVSSCSGLITDFLARQGRGDILATDQLLNAAQLYLKNPPALDSGILDRIFQSLQ